jgi:SpoVK/Ycf46/Vps4 family AAA+-type ATPase
VPIPDLKGRTEILELYAAKLVLDPTVELLTLARRTAGMTGADLANILNIAAVRSSAEDLAAVPMKYLEEAFDRVVVGLERRNPMSDEEKRLTAYHEAEHEMSSAANVATLAAQHNVNMWRKAMEFANAGKTFAVDAMKEAKKAQREAEATKEEVKSSLEHAQLNTQATGVAKGDATKARDDAAAAKLLADTVHGQANKTKAGIEQANKDLDTILRDTKFAAEEAKKAFMYTRKIKESVPKKSAAEASEGPPVPDKSSEDVKLLQSGQHSYRRSLS